MYNGDSENLSVPRGGMLMDEKKKLQRMAALLIIWLAAVSCKMPDALGGVGRAIEGMFRSLGGMFGL